MQFITTMKIRHHGLFPHPLLTAEAKRWRKTEAYVYRRFNGDVELSLTDILELTKILDIIFITFNMYMDDIGKLDKVSKKLANEEI